MCKRHEFRQSDAGDRLSSFRCNSCGHLVIRDRDLGGHEPFSISDLRIADGWMRALVSGQAGLVASV